MTKIAPKFSFYSISKEIKEYLPNISSGFLESLKQRGIIKINPSRKNPISSHFELTRKEVEDIKRIVWMYIRKSEPYPDDIIQ